MRNKWLVGGLVVSVVLNLLIVGFVIGRLASAPPIMAPDPTAGFGRLLRFLPEERRDAVTPMLREQMRDVMREARGLRREHEAVYEALVAEPYDPAALEAALAGLRTTLNATQEIAHRSFVEVAGKLNLEERRQLAEAMRKPPWRREGRHGPAARAMPPPHADELPPH
jgi:uncharacterized membrane protein